MALADVVHEEQEPTNEVFSYDSLKRLNQRVEGLKGKVSSHLRPQGILEEDMGYECYFNMRYQGTETAMMVLKPSGGDFEAEFLRVHLREFSFVFPSVRPILVDDV